MPRRGGGGRAAAPRPRSPSPPPRPQQSYSTHAPAQRPGAPPPAPSQGGGMMAGLGGMVAQGMALGTGSALAHTAINSVFGSRHPDPVQVQQAADTVARTPDDPCSNQAKTFMDCLNYNDGNMDQCRFYFDTLQSCKLDHPSMGP